MKQCVFAPLFVLVISMLFAEATLSETVTDIDGNTYQTVVIGSQVWMAENLRVTHYNNGDSISCVVVDSAAWTGLTTGASGAYGNNEANVATYGRMYNWYAATDVRSLAPTGWHVPTDADWKQLEVYLGMPLEQVDGMGYRGGSPVGGKLKETGTAHWTCPNTTSTNETGFDALPSGFLDNRPVFDGLGTDLLYWAATEFSLGSTAAWARNMTCNLAFIGRNGFAKDYGASVRCVRDEPAAVGDNDASQLPDGFSLAQNYPNPFNPITSIDYSLPTRTHVVLEVYNTLGQRVRTLVNEMKPAGSYTAVWDGTGSDGNAIASGVYLYRLTAGDVVQSRKMLLIK